MYITVHHERGMPVKKSFSLLVAVSLLFGLCACGNQEPVETTEGAPNYTATAEEIAHIEKLYEGKIPLHGEFHDHADTGGTSDGKSTLKQWTDMMFYLNDMDFATVVDHKQVLHMRLPEWDNEYFVGGTEAGTSIGDLSSDCSQWSMHYNMIFANPESLELVLNQFPDKYQYVDDHFKYPQFKKAEFMEVVKFVQANGGFYTHVHPLGDSYVVSTNPEDYWFGDGMGFEVFCGYYGNMDAIDNQEARYYWVKMLDMGKRVFATSGSDSHRLSKTHSLSTFYCDEHHSSEIVKTARTGNFTAGPVGIRSCIGDKMTGSLASFEGQQRLVVAINDFHSREHDPSHTYRIDVYTDAGLVASQELEDTNEAKYFAMDVDPASRYYRVELFDVTEDYIFAVGNPIWNSALYEGDYLE